MAAVLRGFGSSGTERRRADVEPALLAGRDDVARRRVDDALALGGGEATQAGDVLAERCPILISFQVDS